jgi:hypothetical protein
VSWDFRAGGRVVVVLLQDLQRVDQAEATVQVRRQGWRQAWRQGWRLEVG